MLNTLSTTSSTIAAAGAAGNGMNAASLMLRSEANQKEVDELHKRLSVLTEDIAHKQTLIDRLLKEVDKRSEWKREWRAVHRVYECRFSIFLLHLPLSNLFHGLCHVSLLF